MRKSKAVSPVIATLVLIVVAIVGAISVGLIMSRVSSDTAGQANVQNAVGNSQQNLVVGGSSTIAPVVEDAIPQIESQEHIQVQYVTSSSGQGMEGVMINALDIGAASSFPAVQSGITYASSSYPGVNLVYTLVGGSGETVIENAGAGAFLHDALGNTCYGITKAALAAIYVPQPDVSDLAYINALGVGTTYAVGTYTGTFQITGAAACADGYLNTGIDGTPATPAITLCGFTILTCPAATPASPIYTVVYRSDSSGTQDTFSAYIGPSDKNFYAGVGESGNQGMMSYVQSCTATAPCIGFTDLGFANGAALGVGNGDADGVSIAEVATTLTSTATISGTPDGDFASAPAASAAYFPLAIADGSSAATVSTQVLAGLQNNGASIYPDNGATPGSTLVRTFYFVTDGAPNTTEENFIAYFTSSSATSEALWTSNGFFNLYQINSNA